jgi:hypothetical protein
VLLYVVDLEVDVFSTEAKKTKDTRFWKDLFKLSIDCEYVNSEMRYNRKSDKREEWPIGFKNQTEFELATSLTSETNYTLNVTLTNH